MKKKDQNVILMENEETFSQKGTPMNLINEIDEEQLQENASATNKAKIALEDGLQQDKNEECVKEEDGTDLSHTKEESVRELNKAELATRVSQRDDGGQLLKVVKKKEGNAEVQHCDEALERCQGEVELLEYLLEESQYRSEIAVSNRKVSQALVGTET